MIENEGEHPAVDLHEKDYHHRLQMEGPERPNIRENSEYRFKNSVPESFAFTTKLELLR